VLARLAAEVISIERQPELARIAAERLAELGFGNVALIVGDGTRGCPERAPFDAIAVHATAPAPPETLLSELGPGGRLVVPISADRADLLTVFTRDGTAFRAAVIGPARFVPLIGDEGYEE
jgi:protein-L-isoaspartate(D-aspartate) O-methyltransferase